ncbi:MAG: amidase [Bacteroidales bacterium]|jgi:amidase
MKKQNSKAGIVIILFVLLTTLYSCKPEKDSSYLEEMTVYELQKGYREGKFTVRDVVEDYLKRIESIDKNGPELNSVICVNPHAIKIAEELDKEMSEGKIRGPLHGIPVILKDNIDTRDSMPTTAGATVLRNSYVKKDSWVAKKLREAGAVIIAKSNLSEWANFRANLSSSGWSGVGGQTKNPYITDRNPCGSSSGSGVAVSASLCAIAIGTETNGSIVCPSNNNGIVGLKPTVGLISRSGIIPISFTQDTPGPMGRCVEDVAITLGLLTGIDSADSKTFASEGKFLKDYTKYLKENGLKGKRIGLITNVSGFHFKVDSLMKAAVMFMKSAGAEIVEISYPIPREINAASFQVMLYEFKDGLNKYLATLDSSVHVKSLAELIEFNKKDTVELRYFDQQLLVMAQEKGDINSPEYIELLGEMLKGIREEGINKVMDMNKLDALIAPTGAPAWKTDLINGDNFLGSSSSYAAISGYPSITVPMGFIDRMPVGVSFFGRAWSEPMLIEIAYAYEQGTKHRKSPEFMDN